MPGARPEHRHTLAVPESHPRKWSPRLTALHHRALRLGRCRGTLVGPRNGLSTDFTDDTDSGPRFEQSSFPVLAWPSLPSSSIDSFGNHRTHCGNVWPDPISVSLRLEMWRRLPLGTLGRRGRHPIRTGGESPSGERFQSAIRPGSSYLSARSASPREFGHP